MSWNFAAILRIFISGFIIIQIMESTDDFWLVGPPIETIAIHRFRAFPGIPDSQETITVPLVCHLPTSVSEV